MRTGLSLLIALCLCLVLPCAQAESKPSSGGSSYQHPGKQFAENISTLTGVAISPLLGASAYGCVTYLHTDKDKRANLPWFAQPMFFIPALILVAACFIKDSAGTALPTALKKPLDVAETVEHKVSGLIATGAFVPVFIMFTNPGGSGGGSASLGSMGFAGIDLGSIYNVLLIPISMIAFFFVFLASNAINILILLSPFTTVDAALKSFRLAILGTVAGTAWMNPWMGAAWALIIVLISYFIAGWSFRLSHFGLAFVWDVCTFRKYRFKPDAVENKLFLWRKVNKVPARTYGKLKRDEKGNLVLTYRPWLVLPARTMTLPEGNYAVGKAVFWQSLQRVEGDDSQNIILLPPRYRGHEEELVKIYGLTGVREAGLRRAWKWLKELFTGRPATAAAAA